MSKDYFDIYVETDKIPCLQDVIVNWDVMSPYTQFAIVRQMVGEYLAYGKVVQYKARRGEKRRLLQFYSRHP